YALHVIMIQNISCPSKEVQNGCLYAVCGASVNETRDDCLQELERINKEIETVRHEVEEEQRRLSRYQTVHTGSKSAARNSSLAKTETTAKDIDGGSYLLSSCTDFTKTYSRARKYVVDNSKPRTDLEYDPLSNFSADLRSYSSSGKEQKHIKKDLKRKKTVPCDQKKILGHQAHPSRSPSPEPVDDSNEDDVLIIDIPPSPEKKRSRSQKLSDCIAGKSQNTEEELEVKTEPIAALPCFSNAECASASGIKDSLEPASLSAAAHQQAHCLNTFVAEEEENVFQVESPQCELPLSVVKMNPLKPCDFPQTNSIFYKAPVANSDLQSGHHIEQPAYNRIYNHCSPKQMMPSSEPSQHLLGKAANAEVIIIESSSEEEELHYSELDLSDSDPMEECYRIFMEANNENKGNEEQSDMSPLPTKRKLKQQCEVAKVPHDVRQRYVNMFTKEFIKTAANVNDAFEKALAEERSVYNRSVNKLKYLSIAVNALKRLKNQSAVAAKGETLENQFVTKSSLTDYILTEEKLVESNFPVQHPEKPGCAALFADNKKGNTDSLKRICCRCGATYSVSRTGKHIRKEECNYHYGKAVENKVPGGVETRYSCCEGVMGAPGCQVFKLHVHDSLSLDGFVSTVPRHPSDTSCPGVYSLDCEMCYTIHGLELSRVTVVNSSLQVIYDTYVKPDNDVIDYNTRFSGISEEEVKGNHTSLREVQQTLLSFISADTILIGHGLEADLCTLKLLHGTVVDTSVVFPHRLGPPHKLTLNNLTAEYLRRIIQESVCGHDTAEDAAACMELMLWKVKEDGKLKK
uniref:Exonuclease domain-containing protein n=1 Tax=Anabas testudineus TaxID=64144 RepID=A0A7N6ANN1_ANATE